MSASLEDIRVVKSHPVAFEQCREREQIRVATEVNRAGASRKARHGELHEGAAVLDDRHAIRRQEVGVVPELLRGAGSLVGREIEQAPQRIEALADAGLDVELAEAVGGGRDRVGRDRARVGSGRRRARRDRSRRCSCPS